MKLLFHIVLLITIMSCAGNKKENSSLNNETTDKNTDINKIPANKKRIKTDLRETFFLVEKFGEKTIDKPYMSFFYLYDKNGNLLEQHTKSYNRKEAPSTSKTINRYNESNQLVEMTVVNMYGKICRHITNSFKNGKLATKIIEEPLSGKKEIKSFEFYEKDGKKISDTYDESHKLVYRSIEKKDINTIHISNYNGDGSLRSTTIKTLNEDGGHTEIYNSVKNNVSRISSYDKDGHRLSNNGSSSLSDKSLSSEGKILLLDKEGNWVKKEEVVSDFTGKKNLITHRTIEYFN